MTQVRPRDISQLLSRMLTPDELATVEIERGGKRYRIRVGVFNLQLAAPLRAGDHRSMRNWAHQNRPRLEAARARS